MTLDRGEEEKLRHALGVLVDTAPLGQDFDDLDRARLGQSVNPEARRRGVLAAVGAFVVVIAVLTPVGILLTIGDTPPTPEEPTEVPPASTSDTDAPIDAEGFASLRRFDGSDVLMGVRDHTVMRSTDDGATWDTVVDTARFDIVDVASDGAVIAVSNRRDTLRGVLGGDSITNDVPELHRYDPATEQWEQIALPRPDLPAPDLAPAVEGSDECPLFGLQSWVEATAIAAGAEIVITGSHRVVGDGICDVDFPFMWTSPDGITWSLTADDGIDGFVSSMLWTGDRYVALGSTDPHYVYDPASPGSPRVWTSTDLSTWTEHPLNLDVLPERSVVVVPVESRDQRDGVHGDLMIQPPSGPVAVTLDVSTRPRLDPQSVAAIEDVERWLASVGMTFEDVEDMFEREGIDLPLDTDEAEQIESFFAPLEPAGRLTLVSATGTEWTATYAEP